MEMTEKENKKSELEKELVYKPIYLPVRFFKKEAYIHIDDYKEAISKRENAVNGLEEENKKLKEDNRFLTKISKEYMEKENIIQVTEFVELYKDDLEKENERLREELEECECSFGFENDEVGFWKGEYKRLKKWIKDHCKGYGNLFPEDEMKRERKKADKKRK